MSTVTVRLYEKPGYAEGGLVQAAEAVRQKGRWGDEILIHVNPEEFKQMQGMWGAPTHNPHTGLPEYGFLSKLWKKIKPLVKAIAPLALNFIPGVGPALALGLKGLGVGAKLLPLATKIATGALGGAISGGGEGALVGGLTGGLGGGAGIGSKLGLGTGMGAKAVGDALASGAATSAGGGKFEQGALYGGLSSLALPYLNNAVAGTSLGKAMGLQGGLPTMFSPDGAYGMDGLNEYTPVNGRMGPRIDSLSDGMEEVTVSGSRMSPSSNSFGALPSLPSRSANNLNVAVQSIPTPDVGAEMPPPEEPPPEEGSFLHRALGYASHNPLQAVTALAGLAGIGGRRATPGQGPAPAQDPSMLQPLPQFGFNRDRNMSPEDYYTYGSRPERQFYNNNVPPQRLAAGGLAGMATGGHVPTHGGAGGREDTISAQLSEGEYVVDAETVALLGDGSTAAGAAKLEKLRENIRKHKGRALAKGNISPNAKPNVEAYMSTGGIARKVAKIGKVSNVVYENYLKGVK